MQSGAGGGEGFLVLAVLALVLFVVARVAVRSHRDDPHDTSHPSRPPAAWSPPRVPLPSSAPPPRTLPQPAAAPPAVPEPFTAKAFVIDGDTIAFDRGRTRVRLFGIDAPEMSQFGGKAARGHLIRMIGGRRVLVRPVDIDRYGRVVARVRCEDDDVCEAMVRDGYAVAMLAYCGDYLEAERAARHDRRGLWKASADWGIKSPSRHRRIERRKAEARD
jgi:endonuclease YncB( thermonuclease family)